eukprot:5191372-Prymnesium_polylepis.1
MAMRPHVRKHVASGSMWSPRCGRGRALRSSATRSHRLVQLEWRTSIASRCADWQVDGYAWAFMRCTLRFRRSAGDGCRAITRQPWGADIRAC